MVDKTSYFVSRHENTNTPSEGGKFDIHVPIKDGFHLYFAHPAYALREFDIYRLVSSIGGDDLKRDGRVGKRKPITNASENIIKTNKEIVGRWCAASTTADYPDLTFKDDGYVIFDCKIDTFFSLKYSLASYSLTLMSADNTAKKSKILKITRDSLIFESLLNLQQGQAYYRCN